MSHIPNSAMPHAMAEDAPDEKKGGALKKLADKARENPKTAIAAGAAVVAGVAAAAAIPLVKGSRAKAAAGKSGGSGRSRGGKTAKKG